MVRVRRGRRYLGAAVVAAWLAIVGCGGGRSLNGAGGLGGSGAASGAAGTLGVAGAAGTFAAAGTGGSRGVGGSGGAGGGAAAGAGGSGGVSGAAGTPVDGSSDGLRPFCPKSIAEYCADSSFLCTPTWADVLADSSYCNRRGYLDLRAACGSYNVRQISTGGDVLFYGYYDMATGVLVAIGIDGRLCFAGPPDFVLPACSGGVRNPDCPDGGADASGD